MMAIVKRHSKGMLYAKAYLGHYSLWFISAAATSKFNIIQSIIP